MPNNIDLLIIKPGSPKRMYGDLRHTLAGIEPPTLGVWLAGFVREKGYSVKIIDTETENFNHEELADEIAKYNPVLVNIIVAGTTPSSSSTPLMVVTGEILRTLKKKYPDIKAILTGIHPSALPERTLREEVTDFVGKGESFFTVLQLLEVLKSGQEVSGHKIDGLWYLENDQVVSNGWGKVTKNLDEFPLPAWDLLQLDKYRAHNWHCFQHINERSPYAAIYTSFGCPFNCTYCNVRTLYDGKPGIRFQSPEKIVEEIDYLVKTQKVKNIKFIDELFAVSEQRVDSVCDLLKERGYDLNIWAYARINTVNEKMLRKMKEVGINWLSYGIESGSQKVRTGVDKNQFSQDEIKKIIKMTKDAGIYIQGNFIFGLPDDDLETMQETLDLAKELNCEYVNFYATMAYPGSQLYENLKTTDKLPDTWLGYAQLSEETLPLSSKHLSGKEILRFRDDAFNEYFSAHGYLKMIKEKFGQEVVSHIEEMLKYKIKRKFI